MVGKRCLRPFKDALEKWILGGRIENQEATAVGSILQKFHTEIDLRAYLEANEILTLCNNRIVEEEKSKGKTEPEVTDETRRTMITLKL